MSGIFEDNIRTDPDLGVLSKLVGELFTRLQDNRAAMDKLKRQASTVNDKEDEKCGALKNASAKHLRPTFKLRRDTLKNGPGDLLAGNSTDDEDDEYEDGEDLLAGNGQPQLTSNQKVEAWRKTVAPGVDSIDDDQDEGPSSNSNIADQRAGLMAPRVFATARGAGLGTADSSSSGGTSGSELSDEDEDEPNTTADEDEGPCSLYYGEDAAVPNPVMTPGQVRALNEAELSRANLDLRIELQRLEVIEEKIMEVLGRYAVTLQNVVDGTRAYLREYSHASETLTNTYEGRIREEKMLQQRLLDTRKAMNTELKNLHTLATQSSAAIGSDIDARLEKKATSEEDKPLLNYTTRVPP
ncbi:uncharacterized protein SAPINGB_P000682 [Magnusiomyces paraingens]|uniref:Uncharacterized protein n=1 Tax=Magnusiomyces paraingens TaxID=2606893 RepID=A0A5E8B6K2_9ASCO|nr:uncharacterized protein SAPINGB_P000682 [Saprochaete ingens]VVT45234.1 unnamed protein product [Saprochaete ingens]